MRLEYLPYLYILAFVFYWAQIKKIGYKYSAPSIFFEVASCVKYFLIPVLICVDVKYKNVIGPPVSSTAFDIAISITVYEMLCVYFFRYLYIARRSVRFNNNNYTLALPVNIDSLGKIALFSGLFFAVFVSDVFFPKFYLLSEKDADNYKMVPTFSILISIWRYFSYVVFISMIYLKYKERRWSKAKSIFVSFSLYAIYLYLILGASRWGLIFFSSVTFLLLIKMYGKSVKRIFSLFLPIIVVLFFLISFYKFQNEISLSEDFFDVFLFLFARQLQEYFSGITLIAQCVDMSNDVLFSSYLKLSTLLNDLLGFPPLSYLISDPMNKTNIVFNQYVLSVDTIFFTQIMPASGIGYIYFGFLFSPIFVVLFNVVGLYFENKQKYTSDIYMKFIYLYISLWASLSLCFNIQIVLGNIGFRIFPLWLLYMLISHVRLMPKFYYK